ncbi:Glutathione peroxidase, house-cleaning role in reducing lipid peroxides [Variovorax sp. EL159]|nr:Glutathione peroxidase, house-cleaning role in reducing lipid peroxides [Variovorax sp. EL159]
MKMLSRRAFSGLAVGSSALVAAAGGGWPVRSAFAASLGLQDYGRAPEFAGIDKWLNSEPLTMQGLAGKVVLVDFWTYSCINCIHTLPHVVRWYEKYKDQGFVVVGVHSPEFAFEKSTRNVQDAIGRFNIRYPVAQDNSFATWNAYRNQYWPAFYLVDSKGQVMRQHFGEGEYAEMEAAIEALLARKAAA